VLSLVARPPICSSGRVRPLD